MIKGMHPKVKVIEDSEWLAHLVGSRYVGVFDRDKSDFLIEVEYKKVPKLEAWMRNEGFEPESPTPGVYGSDSRLHGSCVWTWKGDIHPNVDILPVSPKEAEMRLAFFAEMKRVGDRRGGLLAKALKQGRGWPALWSCLGPLLDK